MGWYVNFVFVNTCTIKRNGVVSLKVWICDRILWSFSLWEQLLLLSNGIPASGCHGTRKLSSDWTIDRSLPSIYTQERKFPSIWTFKYEIKMKTLIYGKENLVKYLMCFNACHYKFEAGPKIHIFRWVIQSSQVETVTEMAQSVWYVSEDHAIVLCGGKSQLFVLYLEQKVPSKSASNIHLSLITTICVLSNTVTFPLRISLPNNAR